VVAAGRVAGQKQPGFAGGGDRGVSRRGRIGELRPTPVGGMGDGQADIRALCQGAPHRVRGGPSAELPGLGRLGAVQDHASAAVLDRLGMMGRVREDVEFPRVFGEIGGH
jgi:hypothetical protein